MKLWPHLVTKELGSHVSCSRSAVLVTEQQLACVSWALDQRFVQSSLLAVAVSTAGAGFQADLEVSQGQMGSSH